MTVMNLALLVAMTLLTAACARAELGHIELKTLGIRIHRHPRDAGAVLFYGVIPKATGGLT
jgi:hypothetical protein